MSTNYREKGRESTPNMSNSRAYIKYKPKLSMFKNVLATNYSLKKEKLGKPDLFALDPLKMSRDSEIVEHDKEDDLQDFHKSNTAIIPLVTDNLEASYKKEPNRDYTSKSKKSLRNADFKRRSIAASPFFKNSQMQSFRNRKERNHTHSSSNGKAWKNSTQKLKVLNDKRNFTRPNTRAYRNIASKEKRKIHQWSQNKTELTDKNIDTEKSQIINLESQGFSADAGTQVLGFDVSKTQEFTTNPQICHRKSKTGYSIQRPHIDTSKLAEPEFSKKEDNRSCVACEKKSQDRLFSAAVGGISKRSHFKESSQKMQDFNVNLRNIDRWLDQKESSINFNSQFQEDFDNPIMKNLRKDIFKKRGEYLIDAGYQLHNLFSGLLKNDLKPFETVVFSLEELLHQMHSSYESKTKQLEVRYQIVCRMNNEFDKKLKKYEDEKTNKSDSNLSRLITKLGYAYDELGENSKKISKSRKHKGHRDFLRMETINPENSSCEVLNDILHSFSTANIGNSQFDQETDHLEKFNLINEFTHTLQGTQVKTAKSILNRIKRKVQSVNTGVQTSEDLIGELKEMIQQLKQDCRKKDQKINQMDVEKSNLIERAKETQEKMEAERAKAISESMRCEALENSRTKLSKEIQRNEGRLKHLEREKLLKEKLQEEMKELEAKTKETRENLLKKDSELRSLLLKVEDPEFILTKSQEIMKNNPEFLKSVCEVLEKSSIGVKILKQKNSEPGIKDKNSKVSDSSAIKSKTTKTVIKSSMNNLSPSGNPKKTNSNIEASDTSESVHRDRQDKEDIKQKYIQADKNKKNLGFESKFHISENSDSESHKDPSSSRSKNGRLKGRNRSLKTHDKSPAGLDNSQKIKDSGKLQFTNIKVKTRMLNGGKATHSDANLSSDDPHALGSLQSPTRDKSGAKPYNIAIISKVLKKGIHDRLFRNPKGSRKNATTFDDKGIPHSEACGPNCRHLQFLNEMQSKIPDGMYILKQTQHNFGANL
ncbi:unnamed protein product [Moneuplotes crassus]|uniref:Uncharacterized protein n=1 Tax=Euplotes crassus TaxID=5936 RepID=A0AAD1ULG7_EUPCR|nr:unnamed protein product [Moneuplotes crassus]